MTVFTHPTPPSLTLPAATLLVAASLLSCASSGPARVDERLASELGCEVGTEIGGEGAVVEICGLSFTRRCEWKGLYFGERCEVAASPRQAEQNAQIISRRRFADELGCGQTEASSLEGLAARILPGHKAREPVTEVRGCGMRARYRCRAVSSFAPEAPDCKRLSWEHDNLVGAHLAAREDFASATGCAHDEIEADRRSRFRSEVDRVEIILHGCGEQRPYSCQVADPQQGQPTGCELATLGEEARVAVIEDVKKRFETATGCFEERSAELQRETYGGHRLRQLELGVKGCDKEALFVCEDEFLVPSAPRCQLVNGRSHTRIRTAAKAFAEAELDCKRLETTFRDSWLGRVHTYTLEGCERIVDVSCTHEGEGSEPSCSIDRVFAGIRRDLAASVSGEFAASYKCPAREIKIGKGQLGKDTMSFRVEGCGRSQTRRCSLRRQSDVCEEP